MSYKEDNDNNEIKIIYKIKEDYDYESEYEQKIRIFGYNFVINNKNKYKIIYNDKEYELVEYFNDIDNNYNINDIIKLKLKKGINNINNLSCIFDLCLIHVIH